MNNHQKQVYKVAKLCQILKERYPYSVVLRSTLRETYRDMKRAYKHADFPEIQKDKALFRALYEELYKSKGE